MNSEMRPGDYDIRWDAKRFASGVYFITMRSGNFVSTQKVMLVK